MQVERGQVSLCVLEALEVVCWQSHELTFAKLSAKSTFWKILWLEKCISRTLLISDVHMCMIEPAVIENWQC